jgi:hypothetical protein
MLQIARPMEFIPHSASLVHESPVRRLPIALVHVPLEQPCPAAHARLHAPQ